MNFLLKCYAFPAINIIKLMQKKPSSSLKPSLPVLLCICQLSTIIKAPHVSIKNVLKNSPMKED